MRWSYGLTTVPARRRDLLPRTLASLRRAGFESPRLFVDGENDPGPWAREFGLEVTARSPAVRTAGAWILALWELYLRDPAAQRFAVFQDDLVTCRNLRQYLERVPYPEKGYLNLYTFRENEAVISGKPDGWHEAGLLRSGATYHGKPQQTGRGAVALVFDRPAALALLGHPHLAARAQDAHRGWRRIDGGVVEAMNQAGFREFVHAPSLVQHTGLVSSMGNGRHRQAETFPGEDFDALALLPAPARA